MSNQGTALNLEEHRLTSPDDLNALQRQIQERHDPNRPEIVVCHGTGCIANGSPKLTEAIKVALADAGLKARVMPGIKTTGCQGFCSRGPLVLIRPQGIFYQQVKPADAKEIVEQTLMKGEPIQRLLYKMPGTGEPVLTEQEIPFYNLQQRVVLHNIGKIDPSDITDSIAAGGYQALAKAVSEMTSEQVVEAVEASGLRGRGGAGFPTGRKWRSALQAVQKKGYPIYVVLNGDEGDPGAENESF